ncbi:mitochondrial escape protein 2 [Coemansia erecta]|uniref:Mitochondrial escape protein 2 n=1 Tax=Coemansia erecta TaxID=147472 RepID=A0A9W8CVC6_9FUNG|nr:mitochondrial escape protein 2 [Coemansia erecta]
MLSRNLRVAEVWRHSSVGICHGNRPLARGIHVERLEKPEPTGDPRQATYKAALFMDKLFPLKISMLDIRPYIMSRNGAAMKKKVAALIPADLPHHFGVSSIEPHSRDGGSIVNFTFAGPLTQEDAEGVGNELVSAIDKHLALGAAGRNWFDLAPIRSLPVKGVPFSEDIVRMLPSKKVRVEFGGPDLTVEQLFHEFRQFGRIVDIEMQPTSCKDTPRWAIVHFTRLRAATSARNCIHGDVVGATRLQLSYVRERHENVILQWIKDHQKFMIPLAAAALIAAIYAIFDPIREFFVENKITGRFDLSKMPIIGSVRKAAVRSMLWRGHGDDGGALGQEISAWSGLSEQRERLAAILNEPPESFVVVTGPHGSGKTAVVEQATQGKQYRIVIDANKLAAQHSDLEQMTLLARQLGWWPVFNSIISITNAIDLMVAATTGSKAGISATPESQVRRILECLALVLTKIRHSTETKMSSAAASSGDNAAERKASKTIPPTEVPVIVLENFMDKDLPFSKAILEWSASVVEAGLAHCIVTTSGISGYHEIQRAQPQRAASLVSLDDETPMGAISLLQRQLSTSRHALQQGQQQQQPQLAESDQEQDEPNTESVDIATGDQIAMAAGVLGGRLEDLQLFVQKVQTGESVSAALEDIIQRSITEIRKYAFANDSEVGQYEHTWTPEQFWYLLTELARDGSVEYDRMHSSALFSGSDAALLGLAEAQLITMTYDNDRPSRIRPGRPVYSAAFERLLEDPGFSSSMNIKMNKKFIELETAKIRKAEEELALLNVFRASVDAHNTLTSSIAMMAASKDAGRRRSQGSRSDSVDAINPEAYIARAARGSGEPSATALEGQSAASMPKQSWTDWVRGRHPDTTDGAASVRDSERSAQPPTVVPGIPYELQGRVQFLLRTIYKSQQKIDRWDADSQADALRLASL